jgi:hypothetical protein
LHVEFSGDNGVKIKSLDNHASLYLDSHSSKGQYIRFSENDTNKYWINSNSGKLVFRPAATGTTANQIIFDSSGNVGIGKTPSSSVKLDVNGDIAASGAVTGNTIVAGNMLQTNGDCEIDGCELGINGGDITFSGPVEVHDQAEFQNEVQFQSTAVFSDDIQTSNIQVNGLIELDSGDGIDFTGGPAPISGAGNIGCELVTAKGYSLQSSSFTIVSTTSTLAASTNGLTVILQNTGPITITLPTRAAGHVTTFISETIHGVSFVGDTGVTVNSFNGANTTAGQFAQCQVIYKTSTTAFLGGNLV